MKPLKGILPISTWAMRIAILVFVYYKFFNSFKSFNIKSSQFFIAAIFVIFGLLLFFGGFLKKETLTVLSALALLLISIFMSVNIYDAGISFSFSVYALVGSISLFFMATGNKV